MSHHHHQHHSHSSDSTKVILLWVCFGLTVFFFVLAVIFCLCCYIYKKVFKWVAYIGTFVAGAIMLYQLTLALTAQFDSNDNEIAETEVVNLSSLLLTIATQGKKSIQ